MEGNNFRLFYTKCFEEEIGENGRRRNFQLTYYNNSTNSVFFKVLCNFATVGDIIEINNC